MRIGPNIAELIFVPLLQRSGLLYVVIIIFSINAENTPAIVTGKKLFYIYQLCAFGKMFFSRAVRTSLMNAFLVPS